jgi:hypothetical protein
MGVCTICQQATFFRRRAFDKIQGFNIQNKSCWDAELMVDMAISGSQFATTNKVLGYFRIYETSITGSQRLKEEYIKEHERINEKIANAGIIQHPTLLQKGYQLAYKLSPKRHISYFLAR